MEAGELSLNLSGYSTQESGPCTLPGHHSRVDPDERGTGKLASRTREQVADPAF